MKAFSIQRYDILTGFQGNTARAHIILVCNNRKHKTEMKAVCVSDLSVHACQPDLRCWSLLYVHFHTFDSVHVRTQAAT